MKHQKTNKLINDLKQHMINLEDQIQEMREDCDTMFVLGNVIRKHDALRDEWDIFLAKIKIFEPDIEIIIPDGDDD